MEAARVILKVVLTKKHWHVRKFKLPHAILRKVYDNLKVDLPSINREDRLSVAFRAIKNAPNSDTGISPAALVFRVHPKLTGGGKRGICAQREKILS